MIYPWLTDAWRAYLDAYNGDRLHHGILAIGATGLGKVELIQGIASHLICSSQVVEEKPCGKCKSCLLLQSQTHPDFQLIRPEKSIGVDVIREAIDKLSTSAQLLGNKVLVIEKADLMSVAAANSLLKTLEEPTASTYILMTSSNPQKLPATILSRCYKLSVAIPTQAITFEWLQQQGVSSVDEKMIHLAGGSPLKALELSEKGDSPYEGFIQSLRNMLMNQTSVNQFVQEQLVDSQYGFKWLQNWLVNRAKKDPKYLNLFANSQQTYKNLQRTGINKSLVLNKFCADLKATLTNN